MGKTIIKQAIIFSGIICSLLSCKSDPLDSLPIEPSGENLDVLFKLTLPTGVKSQTDNPFYFKECEVSEIDVLIFQMNDVSGKEEFAYRAIVQSFTTGSTPDELVCVVKLVKTTNQCRLVIFANLTEELNNLPGIIPGIPKDNITSAFIYSRQNEWETPEKNEFTPFPMWAETGLTSISEETRLPTVNLLRMVSRIDVKTDETLPGETFTLESARIYNRKTNGLVVPLAANVDTQSGQVNAATLPENEGTVKQPSFAYLKSDAADKYINYIYTLEAAPPVSDKAEDANCLVIGGKYDQSSQETYYRIDFAGKEGEKYGSLLRNSHYTFNIINVLSNGYTTPDDAFEGQSMNISGEIIEWNQGETTHITFFGPHFIAVDRKDVLLGSKAGNRLTREMSTNIEPDKIKLSFIGDHNGATTEISDGIGIENDRFRIRIVQSDEEITHITFTALNTYNPALPETNKQEMIFSAYNIRFTIHIEQQDNDPSDWKHGGDYDFEF